MFEKFRALLGLSKSIDEVKNTKEVYMKSGFLSSEFVMSLLATLLSVYGAIGQFIPADLSIKIVAGIAVAYALLRSLLKVAEIIVKITASTKDDEYLAKIEALTNGVASKLQEKGLLK